MVEFLMHQNRHGEMLRIVAYNAKRRECAVVFDTMAYRNQVWYCNKVIIESHAVYHTMRKLIMSMSLSPYDNILDKSYDESMGFVGKVMPKFRVPHFDELIILDYRSMVGTLVRQDRIHTADFHRKRLHESFADPYCQWLTKIKSIIPNTPEENANLLK